MAISKLQNIRFENLVHKYEFFRLLILTVYTFLLLVIVYYCNLIDLIDFKYILTWDWIFYSALYWLTNPLYCVIILITLSIINFGIFWKSWFIENIEFSKPTFESIIYLSKSYKIIFFYIIPAFISFYITFVSFPLIHLAYNNAKLLIIYQLGAFLVSLSPFYSSLFKTYKEKIKPLSKQKFSRISYNTASMGQISVQSRNELLYYRNLSKDKIDDYIVRGSESSFFKGFKGLYKELSQLIDGNKWIYNYHEYISTHDKTTDAFRYCMHQIVNIKKNCKLVYTDAEYSTIKGEIENLQEDHLITKYEINVEDDLIKGSINIEGIQNKYLSKLNDLKKAGYDNIVIVISHVLCRIGLSYPLENFLKKIREVDDKIIVVVDGAQALGNINVKIEAIKICDFYIGCGHKWLLGHETLGFIFYNPYLLKQKGFDINSIIETKRSFSFFNYEDKDDETVNFEPIVSLVTSLKDINSIHNSMQSIENHNSKLVEKFTEKLYTRNEVEFLSPNSKGGIISLKFRNQKLAELVYNILTSDKKYDIDCKYYESANIIRFSFHFFMGSKDVMRLVHALTHSIIKGNSILKEQDNNY